MLSTWNEAAAPHTPIQNQMQEVHYQVVQPPSWENKDPTNRLCSGHKGGGESVKAISPPPNGSHEALLVSYKGGVTQPDFRAFLVSKLRTITKEPQLTSFY